MDRVRQEAANLEALTEESENEDHGKQSRLKNSRNIGDEPEPSDSDSDDDGDGGLRNEEPNKFDGLCDGVLDSLALVHGSMDELLELKDTLLKHALPPSVLAKVALSTTKVFRSVSDMNMPVNELIRLVHLYSTPWEEKSAALQKLHEDYESKKNQLNIAVKRLQLIDAHSKRIARERRIMNWEKIFSKLTSERGHGRRWKFLIQTFKNKAKEGLEPLQAYVSAMEKKDEEDEDADIDQDIDTQMAQMSPTVSEEQRAKDLADEERQLPDSDDSDDNSDNEQETEDNLVQPLEPPSPPKEMVDASTEIKPDTEDVQMWTHEPVYWRQLHIRVYEPEGLDDDAPELAEDVKCALTYGSKARRVVGPFRQSPASEAGKDSPKDEGEGSKEGESASPQGGRLIGRRSKASPTENGNGTATEALPMYHEVVFPLPSEVAPPGIWTPKDDDTPTLPTAINIAVNQAEKGTLIGAATIDMQDLHALDFPSLVLPPLEDGETLKEGQERFDPAIDSAFKGLKSMKYPLYFTSGDTPVVCGKIPLACFWTKTLKPLAVDKTTGSESVNDIVYDVTGFDMNVMKKEDLHKELQDECLSAPRFTPEAPLEEVIEEEEEKEEQKEEEQKEETVGRGDYDKLQHIHREEMEQLTDEYEDRLQEMMQQMHHMQAIIEQQGEQHAALQEAIAAAPHAPTPPPPRHQSASSPHSPHTQPPARATTVAASVPQPSQQPPRPRHVGRPPPPPPNNSKVWGEHLPKDFLSRLAVFEQQSAEHQQDLQQRVSKEVSERIEKSLAGEFKISNQPGDEEMYDAMKDVSLPAVFMPHKSNNMNIYNPRAHNYFHSAGGGGSARLTQPPSMLQLPPIPHSKLSVVNLFDLSQNFQRPGGQEWLMQRYLHTQLAKEQQQRDAQQFAQQEQAQQQQQQLDNPRPLEADYATPSPAAPTPARYPRVNSRGMSGGRQRTAVME